MPDAGRTEWHPIGGSMRLYHASRLVYASSQVIAPSTNQSRFGHALPAIEAHRPNGAPSRSCCVFAAESPQAAFGIVEAESPEDVDLYVYEVDMPVAHRAPMRLISEIERRLARSKSADALIHEYWNPQYSWQLLEHFGPEFTVVGQVVVPSRAAISRFKLNYEKDVELSRHLFP